MGSSLWNSGRQFHQCVPSHFGAMLCDLMHILQGSHLPSLVTASQQQDIQEPIKRANQWNYWSVQIWALPSILLLQRSSHKMDTARPVRREFLDYDNLISTNFQIQYDPINLFPTPQSSFHWRNLPIGREEEGWHAGAVKNVVPPELESLCQSSPLHWPADFALADPCRIVPLQPQPYFPEINITLSSARLAVQVCLRIST